MSPPRAFMEVERVPAPERDPSTRTADHGEIFLTLPTAETRRQAGRCMSCGIPFCHDARPVGNLIPEWNELASDGHWRAAIERLHSTNDFPEFTGLICPAPCEAACTLEINDEPVMIKQVELAIVERAFEEGWVVPRAPAARTGRTVAVVGSGPAGLAAAAQLNRRGHLVTVYERDEGPGGLLRFGIPDFKLEKWIVDRRVALLEAEGVEFRYGVEVGAAIDPADLRERHDAVVLALGSRAERPLGIDGDDLGGVHQAMEYLYARNRAVAAAHDGAPEPPPSAAGAPTAAGRDVIVIGGGDTAADCVASAHRERARSVTLLDIYPAPDGTRPREIAGWPDYPKRMPSNYALDEGGERRSSLSALALEGRDGHVTGVRARSVGPPPGFDPVAGSESVLPADLVLVAIGFTHPEHDGAVGALALDLDDRGNVTAPGHATNVDGVFAAGDARRGQSLVVTAIQEGRSCAAAVAAFLGG
ncbi:MAG: glutamate synthase small chain [Thermoleophilaceae bacterium]|nr:glutamate synthase small chain [Thermoleophilaceae bacterium]